MKLSASKCWSICSVIGMWSPSFTASCVLEVPCIFAVHIDCTRGTRRRCWTRKNRAGMCELATPRKTIESLLEPIGFQIESVVGIGTPAIYHADRILRAIRNRFGDWAALPLLPIALPAVWFATLNPRMPFSLYVKAIKPAGGP